MNADAVVGCLLGLAVGDALGLPREKLSRHRGERLFPDAATSHQFFFHRGFFSDDTEHACFVAQALLCSGGDPIRFQSDLARRLRWWSLALPAGAGKATLLACFKIWLGVPLHRSGVYSAGNAAGCAQLLGVCLGNDPEKLSLFLRASTLLTHTDPKAEYGAFAAAWAAYRSSQTTPGTVIEPRWFVEDLRGVLKGDRHSGKLIDRLDAMVLSLERGHTTEEFADVMEMDRGVGGYVYETVPVALHAWFRHGDDYRAAVGAAIRCGGDTDTLAAITGGIVGARVGKAGIPAEWLAGIADWPRSVRWVEELAVQISKGEWRSTPQPAKPLAVWALPLRNALFLMWVLKHGFRRLLPPY